MQRSSTAIWQALTLPSHHGHSGTRSVRTDFESSLSAGLIPFHLEKLPSQRTSKCPRPASSCTPLSPLSPSSTLYPDGLINTDWLQKHQERVPSVYLCFYTLTSDQGRATLLDNQLKTDINAIKAEIAKSGYKTKLAVALMSETAPLPQSLTQSIQERLENIRKGTGLDTGRSIFYIAPRESPEELTQAADTILTALYPQSIEYYRDLGLRYDFKSGVFAEFRQEAEAAMRAYEQAYDGLLGDDVWDLIPSWSPRWNEARLLCDIIAIRVLRCFLWNEQTSMAVSRWQAHRDRIGDFIDQRGQGTNNYGWKAWETRWSLVMANLVERVGIPALGSSTGMLFLQPEKAAWHTAARRALAHKMPEEDREEPTAPSSAAPQKAGYLYDTYLCPEPWEELPVGKVGVDYSQLIIDCLMAARGQFEAHGQYRLVAEVSLECARESAKLKQWEDVIALLRPVWEDMPFRKEGWNDIVEDVNWTLRAAAAEKGLGELVLAIDWELLHRRFTRRKGWAYDLSQSLAGLTLASRPIARLADDTVSSFVTASFVFRASEGRAGEVSAAQLVIASDAVAESVAVPISSLKVEFEGGLKTILLTHDPNASGPIVVKRNVAVTKVPLKEQETESDAEAAEGDDDDDDEDDGEERTLLCGSANLTLGAGQSRAYDLAIPLREPGEARATSVLISVNKEAFRIDYSVTLPETSNGNVWVEASGFHRMIGRPDGQKIQVQPRPPKMEIKLVGALEQYYANERISLMFEVGNEEDEDAVTNKVSVEVALDEVLQPASLEFGIRVSYHLASDPGTRILQKETFTINVVSPFEANYELLPRVHLDPWPSLFDPETIQDLSDEDGTAKLALGLAQRWCLRCRYASFATEELRVVGLEAQILSSTPGTRCSVKGGPTLPAEGLEVQPRVMHDAEFDIMAQKLSLDDRNSARVEAALVIKWRRANDSNGLTINTTTMPVPAYTMLSTEPRVLASLSKPLLIPDEALGPDELVDLDITIENPSGHFLTFGLTMEPSDEFAFSGAKKTTVHVLPVARRTVSYRVLPLVRGDF
ncbi:unnamed protein product [Parascedosporium putredinis]|uniref:Trafficking protein particle complex subunit 11 n=1 Tax=Parascedosporium putredinis TaxID=1442378 RepID=A0A9P1H977_9PEZI|nr:unnamed protein product [Parascedosporium putredinis]CAI7999982.1 unnamed protein product [Parascedosporium putredinis]